MAEEPEQLGLANKDQAAQDKALDQLTDHVSSGKAFRWFCQVGSGLITLLMTLRSKKKNWTQVKCPQPWLGF